MHVHANLKKHQPSSQCCLQEGQLDVFCTINRLQQFKYSTTLFLTIINLIKGLADCQACMNTVILLLP